LFQVLFSAAISYRSRSDRGER